MEENLVTTEKIIAWLTEQVEKKNPIDPHTWISACQKLNILSSKDREELYVKQQEVAKEKVRWIEIGKTASEAKIRIEATDTYRNMKSLEGKLRIIEEAIRIAKIQAKLSNQEFQGN